MKNWCILPLRIVFFLHCQTASHPVRAMTAKITSVSASRRILKWNGTPTFCKLPTILHPCDTLVFHHRHPPYKESSDKVVDSSFAWHSSLCWRNSCSWILVSLLLCLLFGQLLCSPLKGRETRATHHQRPNHNVCLLSRYTAFPWFHPGSQHRRIADIDFHCKCLYKWLHCDAVGVSINYFHL